MTAQPQRDTAILAEWALRYRKRLRVYFNRHSNANSTEVNDLIQDVFASIAHRSDIATIERAENYIFSCARNVLIDRNRRNTVRNVDAHMEFEDSLPGGYDPERILLGQEALERIGKAMQELPALTSAAFTLYHFEDWPHARIASHLGIAISTVEKHMARANRHLLRRMTLNT